jgi:RNA polymerase sigma-70 factor (ECF subfamily)
MAVSKPATRGTRAQASERLLVQAAQKDPAQFGQLYEENFERVYAYVAHRVRSRDLAEDLTSEVFHKALAALPNFDWRGVPFSAWLLRIAANVVVDQWKHSAAREIVEDPPEIAAEANLEEIEHRARLFRLVDKLPADQQRVIRLRFAEGRSMREIANELGRTEGAVKQLQFRALQTLRAEVRGHKQGQSHA